MHLPGPLAPAPAFRVRLLHPERVLVAEPGETLLACLRRAAGVSFDCGGRGGCASCVVRVVSGVVRFFPDAGREVELAAGDCRACRVAPASDLVVELTRGGVAREGESGLRQPLPEPVAAPAVRVSRGGKAELARVLRGGLERIEPGLLGGAARNLRDDGGGLAALIRKRTLIGTLSPAGRALGLGIDLGTTNVAGSLTDLESGALLAAGGLGNPQARFGRDLISRIDYALAGPGGAGALRDAALGAIGQLAEELCREAGRGTEEIVDVAICGNTVMHHLLLGLPVAQLGRVPFTPARCAPLDLRSRDFGFPFLPGAWVHLFPNVGGFVGGDHVAALLATEPLWREGTTLVVDLGTNAEIALIRGGGITTASAAAGPALEGGNISCGMRAAAGAIEKVWVEGGTIRTRTVGGEKAVGICGSGVVDAVAALREAGVLNRRGYLEAPGGYPLTPEVRFTQEDVRAVQLAKGAVRAGIDLLLADAGVTEEAVDRIVVAGGFGAYLDILSALAIGLFPPLPADRFLCVGNAAAAGVRMALVSVHARRRARELARRCRHLELGGLPEFNKAFMKRIGL